MEEILFELHQELQDLQKTYIELKEDIMGSEADLQEAFDTEQHKIRRKLKRLQEQQEAVNDEISRIEKQIRLYNLQRICHELPNLNYVNHFQTFVEFVTSYPVGAFIVHGDTRYGVQLLLKRILQHFSWNLRLIQIDIPALKKPPHGEGQQALNDLKYKGISNMLWSELEQEYHPRYAFQPQIAEKIAETLKTQHVVLKCNVDVTCTLKTILSRFWRTLASMVQDRATSNCHCFLLLLVITDSSDLKEYPGIRWAESYQESWTPDIPVKLPVVDRYDAGDIQTWMLSHTNILPFGCTRNIAEQVHRMLEQTQNGFADNVVEYICTELCQCKFEEGDLEQWLNN